MKLAIFDDYRLGVVSADEQSITDVTAALPTPHDPDPVGASWWVRMCRDFPNLRGAIEAEAAKGSARKIQDVTLRPAALNPSKVIAAALNYMEHVEEMRTVTARVGSADTGAGEAFDVFLKAPSSIIGPGGTVLLPRGPVAEKKEIHHESELAFVIGKPGKDIPPERAFDHILGYTIALDMTVRGGGDRSRRKSYNTFTPIGPWVVTADEIPDAHDLEIHLTVNGMVRQHVNTRDMRTRIPEIIAYASSVFTLLPGDVFSTGAPPGVGEVFEGDVMDVSISHIGSMQLNVDLE